MFQKLTLPKYDFNLKTVDGSTYIFDIIRKKHVVLTAEEWVRQHIVHFLIHEKHYPAAWMEIEKGLSYNKMNKRADIICNDRTGKPFLLVECKAASITLNQSVFEQIARYNFELQVPYLLVSNGLKHVCCKMNYEDRSYSFLKNIPDFL